MLNNKKKPRVNMLARTREMLYSTITGMGVGLIRRRRRGRKKMGKKKEKKKK